MDTTQGIAAEKAGWRMGVGGRYGVLAALAAAAVVVTLIVMARLGACNFQVLCGAVIDDDVAQGRLDIAPPPPRGAAVIEQSFVPNRHGLTQINLLLARYGELQPGDDSTFTLELWDGETRVAEQTLATVTLTHNQPVSFSFPAQRHSAGRRYVLRLSGSEANPVSVWAYSLDAYGGGELSAAGGTDGQSPLPAADLRFVTQYALTWGDALGAAVAPLRHDALRLLAAALLLPLPGVWLLLLFRPRRWDGATWLGAALALGIAVWPLLWLWLSLLGGRWSGVALWVVVAVGWLGVAALVARRWLTAKSGLPTRATTPPPATRHAPLVPLLLFALVVVSLAVRFIAVRDQAFPPWVDSSRHALITAVMVETGRAPDGYAPYLPVEGFPYHFGFHSLSAGLALMTGWPLPGLLLTLGQLLNGLMPLAVYAAGRLATGRRSVGLLAAFFVALPSFFPGYYATWGRMTQLSAMIILAVLLALTWRLGRGWSRLWPLVGLLAAGLFLVHFRVFLFYLPFAALFGAGQLLRLVRTRGRGPATALGPLLMAAGLALLLVMPRVVALLAATNPLDTLGQSQAGYNDFPMGYVTTGWERIYLGLAADAVLIVLVAAFYRRRWATFPLLLLVWVAALFVLLAGERLGLPETVVVNLNSMYITLFLPLSLLIGVALVELWRWVEGGLRRLESAPRPAGPTRLPSLVRGLVAVLAGLAIGLAAVFGARQQANILNPQTILARPQDVPALAWMGDNLPADARVAVNAWQWLGVTWAGSDGGAWLLPLTGRAATTPPVDHIYDANLFTQVRAFNESAMRHEDWSDPAAADWLRAQGVTHVYAGQRGGPLDPAELSRNPGMALLFHNEGTFVFQVLSEQ